MLERFHPDRSQSGNQENERRDQNGTIEESLKVRVREKAEELVIGEGLSGPEKPGRKSGAQHDGSNQVGENLKAGAQGKKQLAWTPFPRKLKFRCYA